ncbi:MAG: alpha/beta hydrolase [Eubacteriales bacterium]|nr:alpha/beta hydrolase [Eubacteriales bacterium]
MAYTRFCGTYRSANHKNRIHYYIFEPEADIRAILQMTHGWKDYIERNENLIRFFTDRGVMVCGCDFIGHGRSSTEEERGHFEEKNGWCYLVKDVKRLTVYIRREYPDVPCFLYGHGMGSLVARLACMHGALWDGVILSGTSGRQRYCRRAVLAAVFLGRLRRQAVCSHWMERMIVCRLNRRFRKEKDVLSWFSGDAAVRKEYASDERTRFHFTLRAYENILKMLALVSSKKWYQKVETAMPVLLLSGREDPIGNFGKGVEDVRRKLVRFGCRVEMKLYDSVRHELQSDPRHEEVFSDMMEWMNYYMKEPSGLTIIY